MKVFFILLSIPLAIGSTYSKKAVQEIDYKSLNNKTILLKGTITELKHNIRARSNFYTFILKLKNHPDLVKVEVYTINWLKRVNFFKCKNGDYFSGRVMFKYERSQDFLGNVAVHQENETLKCSPEDTLDVNTTKVE